MSIGMKNWRFEISDQGICEPWTTIAKHVQGTYTGYKQEQAEPAWVLDPDYQRGPVWTTQQQSRFIGHVLAGGVQPPLYLQRYKSNQFCPQPDYWNVPEEVIDGQQRLRAITAFMTDQICAEVYHDGSWHQYWLKDMDKGHECNFMVLSSTVVYMDLPRQDRLRFYLRLNGGGVPHTEQDLDRVRELLGDSP